MTTSTPQERWRSLDLAKPLRALATAWIAATTVIFRLKNSRILCPRWHLLRELAAALGLRWEQEPIRSDADDDVEIEAAVEARRGSQGFEKLFRKRTAFATN